MASSTKSHTVHTGSLQCFVSVWEQTCCYCFRTFSLPVRVQVVAVVVVVVVVVGDGQVEEGGEGEEEGPVLDEDGNSCCLDAGDAGDHYCSCHS